MEEKKEDSQLLKIIIVGNAAVGKSSIRNRLEKQEFNEQQYATLGAESISIEFEVEKSPFILKIWDFVGQDLSIGVYFGISL